MQDDNISTCLMAYTDEYGRTWSIFFNEVLWFGTNMDHFLIDPNHIRMAGIPVSDYPFDKNKNIGIFNEKLLIRFGTDGTTVYFDSRVPIKLEITECSHIVMMGDT